MKEPRSNNLATWEPKMCRAFSSVTLPEEKKTTTKKLQCVLPPHQHPHRNPQLLLSRSDGESSKTAPAWAPTLGPCWPLIWLPAWPITPPAKETYVVVEKSAGSQLSASHFCTTQDVGQLTKHKKGDSYIKRYAIASWKMKEAGMKKTNREVDLRFFFFSNVYFWHVYIQNLCQCQSILVTQLQENILTCADVMWN